MAGDITQPKRPRYESNERFDTVDANAASQAPRDQLDAATKSLLSTPRNTVATPTGLIVTGFSLTPNPTAGNDGLVRINAETGVALDANGRSIIKPNGTTIDVTIPIGTFQIYAYYTEVATDNAKRRFLPAAPPFVEFTKAIDTAFQGSVNVFLRAGGVGLAVAEDVVNGATTALCLIGVATNAGAGAITITGWNAVTAPNGTDITNRLSTVVAPTTVPTTNTRNGSMKTLHDLITAVLYTAGQTAWLGSDFLTPTAANNYGAYSPPAGGADKAYREVLAWVTIGDGVTVFGDFNTSDYADSNALLTAALAFLPTAGGVIFLKRGTALTNFNAATVALPAGKTVEIRGDHSTVPSTTPQLTFAPAEALVCSATGKLILRDLHIRFEGNAVELANSPCEIRNVYVENVATVDVGAAFQGVNVSDLVMEDVRSTTVLTTATANAMLLRITGEARRVHTKNLSHFTDTALYQNCGLISITDMRDNVEIEDTTYENTTFISGGGSMIVIDTTDNTTETEIVNRRISGLDVSKALIDNIPFIKNDSVGYITVEDLNAPHTIDGASQSYLQSFGSSVTGPITLRRFKTGTACLGISIAGATTEVTVEDCRFEGFAASIGVSSAATGRVTFRNNVCINNIAILGCNGSTIVSVEFVGNRWYKSGFLFFGGIFPYVGYCAQIDTQSTVEVVRFINNRLDDFFNVVYGAPLTVAPSMFVVRADYAGLAVCQDNVSIHSTNYGSGSNHKAGNLFKCTSSNGTSNATIQWGTIVVQGNTVGTPDDANTLFHLDFIVPFVIKIHGNTVTSRWDTSAGVALPLDWIRVIYGTNFTITDLLSITDNDFRIINVSATQVTEDWLAYTAVTVFSKCVSIQNNHLSMSDVSDFAVGMAFTILANGIVAFALTKNMFERNVALPSYWFKTSFSNNPLLTLPPGGPPAPVTAWAENLTIHSL